MTRALECFVVPAVPPFSLYYTVRILQRLPSNRVDRWEDGAYRRLIGVGRRAEPIRVRQVGDSDHPAVEVQGRFSSDEFAHIRQSLERLLGLRTDLGPFYSSIQGGTPLYSLAVSLRGMKPPRYLTLFEALANAICCQQVSLTVGILMMNRVAEMAGPSRGAGEEKLYAFPSVRAVTALRQAELKGLGLSAAKATALVRVAEELASGRVAESALAQMQTGQAIEALCTLPGIGPWSARYALLRGLGRLEVFPSGDAGAARTLGRLIERPGMTAAEAHEFSSHWKQYAGMLYFHLLGSRYLSGPLSADSADSADSIST